jgi:hypothetical protein
MSKDLESQLRDALRPVAPSDPFTEQLLARLAAERYREPHNNRFGWRTPKSSGWWLSASLAASVFVAVGIHQQLRAAHERETGMEARRQVIEALRVTTQKLDLAYQVVRTQSSSLSGGDAGV